MENNELHASTVELLLNVLKKGGHVTDEFFETVGVSDNKTKIVLGTIQGEKIRVVFFVSGELHFDKGIKYKLGRLLDAYTDITELNELLSNIDKVIKINYTPFTKVDVDKSTASYGFMINIYYHEKGKVC